MIAYYAHSMHLYNTEQEKRDVEIISSLGLKVYNPNNENVQKEVEEYKARYGADKTMDYFKKLIEDCDLLVFRSHPDGKIPSGVGFEINYARLLNKPIIELPCLTSERFLSVADTRYYLELLGQR